MANSFKTLTSDDKSITRTLLHEAIPISGNIVSGTYSEADDGTTSNIKRYSHGRFESVYDYPYLSASSNHLFDISAGYSATSSLSASNNTENAKKINMYTEMAQTLAGYDVNGEIIRFDKDGNLLAGGDKIDEAFFINFSRLLYKDEIKKGSFSLDMYSSGSPGLLKLGDVVDVNDTGSQEDFRVNSPAGEYGILKDGGTNIGLIYYQAGTAVVTASFFDEYFGQPNNVFNDVDDALANATVEELADGLRHTIHDIDFNNSVELNSANYFCRAKNDEFNYSSNPTYTSASKLRVKNNSQDLPISYITTAGLYSADNELLAVGKLSEPVKKTPEDEVTIRLRLDY